MTDFVAADNEILWWIRDQISDGMSEGDGQAPPVDNVRLDMVRNPADWSYWQFPAIVIDCRGWTPGEEYHTAAAGYALIRDLNIWLVAITRGETQATQTDNRALIERLAGIAGQWNVERSAIIQDAAGRVGAVHVQGAGWTLYHAESSQSDTRYCVGALRLRLRHQSA